MKTKYQSIITFAVAALFCVIFATSCHTVRGLGRDVEKTGEHIQQGTR